jgi:uncharacterized membrane protein
VEERERAFATPLGNALGRHTVPLAKLGERRQLVAYPKPVQRQAETPEFAEDRNTRSQKFYRVINEIPTALMIGIVILVIIKPF